MATILILEDDMFIGLDMARTITRAGHVVMGPCVTAEEALDAMAERAPDAAFLDVNLGDGRTSFEVADRLLASQTPFVFLTGYSASGGAVAERFPDVERLSKPCQPADLTGTIDRLAG